MKKVIYKYELKKKDSQIIRMVRDAKILSCQNQYGDIVIWAEVDPDETETEPRQFVLYGTGVEYDYSEHMFFINTAILNEGRTVIHVFELMH